MRKFGITSETRGASGVSIPAPTKLAAPNPMFTTGYEFPVCKLVSVKFNPVKTIKRAGQETVVYALEFLFKDNKDRQFTHIEFPLDPTSKNAEKEPDWQDQKIKHIWEETIGANKLPAEGIGTTATTEAEYYELIAKAFNDVKVEVPNPKAKEPVKEGEVPPTATVSRVAYGQTHLYIKLTYNKNRLQLPLFPNFIQRAVENGKQVPVEKLIIDPAYDLTEASAPAAASTPISTGLDAGFAGGTEDLPPFLQ